MKLWKRFGAAVLSVLILTAMLTGTALAAEPDTGIAVQMDGKQLSFTDAVPELVDGRTFLPFRAVFEAMGAEVGYDEQTKIVSAKKGGVELSMIPGQTDLIITENGQTRTQTMDVAPYIKADNSRTYVPVRFAAEALGYSVGWDPDDQTVILVDVDALFAGVTFDLMDNFAAYCEKQQNAIGNMSITGELSVDAADRSGLVLKEPLKIKGNLDGVAGEKGVQLTGKIDGSSLYAIFETVAGGSADTAALQELLKNMPQVSAELRVDLASKMLYASVPNVMTGGSGNTWYSLDLSAYEAQMLAGLDMAQLTQEEDMTIREALIMVMKSLPLNDKDMSYQILAQLAQTYASTLGDQAFTQNGDAYTAKMTLEEVVDLDIVLTKKGDDITAIDLTMTSAADEDGMKMSMTMTEHAAPDKVTVKMAMNMESAEMSMKFDMDLSCVPTSNAPVTTLPAGVQAVPMG